MNPRILLVLMLPLQLLSAQDSRDEVSPTGSHSDWQFQKRLPAAARLFNAFDYGHAVLYERLLTEPNPKRPLADAYRFLTEDLLLRPPRFAIPEEVIAPAYAKLAWPAMVTFDRAHLLHRQIYDVYADPRLTRRQQDTLIERLTDRYLGDRTYALSPLPKSMELMDGQSFSLRFRRQEPRFNGLIWAYHWLQVGLYQPFAESTDTAVQRAGVMQRLAEFREMLKHPDDRFPRNMPMTPATAPAFTKAHPRAAAIFDNLHMLHDIISDILASPTMSRDAKRAEILRQLTEMRDATKNVMEMEHWWMMGH